MAITRVTAVWSGFRGAPGYSNFFFGGEAATPEDAEDCAGAVRAFFSGITAYLPSSVRIQVNSPADILNETTGEITGQVDFDPPASVEGSGGADYSAASGGVVNWNTSGYRNGRRIRGRTFLVPLGSIAYDPQGDLGTGVVNGIRTASTQLTRGTSALPFVVWARPKGGVGGSAEPVTGATVPDLGAILRSRRD